MIKQLLELERYLFQLWEGGFERALEAGDAPKEYYELRDELARIEPTLRHGGEQQWNYFRTQQQRLHLMEQELYNAVDVRYNGLLRRLNNCLTVLTCFQVDWLSSGSRYCSSAEQHPPCPGLA